MIITETKKMICENLRRNDDGELSFADMPLSPLAEKYGTPLYLMDENLIREKFQMDCACGGTDTKMKVFITVAESADSVKKFISEKTGIYSSMFEIIVVDEIPRNSTGKILYKQLETK